MAEPATVDEYLAGVPEGPRTALEDLRKIIKAAAPDATELISYGMPAFKHNGKFLVSFAAYRDHCSLFPASQGIRRALGRELASSFSGKGTIRFPADKPLSAEVVRKIVKVRLDEVAAGGTDGQTR
jgi:uncharacterized protein YdhG (YjbR/CyaY superfamily)